jgi:hypothetical protein
VTKTVLLALSIWPFSLVGNFFLADCGEKISLGLLALIERKGAFLILGAHLADAMGSLLQPYRLARD